MSTLHPLPKRWLRLTAALPIALAATGLVGLALSDLGEGRPPRPRPQGAPFVADAPAAEAPAPAPRPPATLPAPELAAAELPPDVLAAWRFAERVGAERSLRAAPAPGERPAGPAEALGRRLAGILGDLPPGRSEDALTIGRGLGRLAEFGCLDAHALEHELTRAEAPAARVALLRAWALVADANSQALLEPLVLGDPSDLVRREALQQLVVLGELECAERLLVARLTQDGPQALPRVLPRSPQIQERLADAFLRAADAEGLRLLGRALLAQPDKSGLAQRVHRRALESSEQALPATEVLIAALPATREALETVRAEGASPTA
ncbi:MAG: hypothetical protein KDD82_28245, partial [Planctomycetes bacterium]|nr:hypothetical protein [Planctomycetota bacterium]